MKYTYKMQLIYDGTNYSGWQIQSHSLSIQQLVQEAVRTVTKEAVNVIGSGRTDAGVHALDQVAHFRVTEKVQLESFQRSINGILPKDIRLALIEEASPDFHAQRSAIAKEYHYHISYGPYASPFERNYVWHVAYRLDLDKLRQACRCFVGTHDFTSFTNSAHHGACAKNPIRTITNVNVIEKPNRLTIEFNGNGFLYKMVRNMVGMIIEVASGKRTLEEIPLVMAAKDRRLSGHAAPAQGLFLVKVFYG